MKLKNSNSLPCVSVDLDYLDDAFVIDLDAKGVPRFRRAGTFDYYGILDDLVVWTEKPRERLMGFLKTSGRSVWATPYSIVVDWMLSHSLSIHPDRRLLLEAFLETHPRIRSERWGLVFNGLLPGDATHMRIHCMLEGQEVAL